MSRKINVSVYRFDPSVDAESVFRTYKVPWKAKMSVMNALDYIYQNMDSTLAYYDHAGCALGICARCTGKINGKAGLFCQVPVTGDVTLDPISTDRVLKDLVCEKKQKTP